MVIAAPEDTSEGEMATARLLRREIGFLSERQRLVIYMHYYDKLPVAEIARRLRISAGTVKWHLSDARSKLKAGIDMDIEKNLDIDPIRFSDMGHSGNPGSTGDTSNMFDTRLKQNIAWACYHQPRTLEEIARAVGVPQVYVADELRKLVDYAYIDRLDDSRNPRYRTNMVITDSRIVREGLPEAFDKAAEWLCDSLFAPLLRAFEESPEEWGFEGGSGDLGYYKYGLLYIVQSHLQTKAFSENDLADLRVKRPDGGDFVAFATVSDNTPKTGERYKYWSCGMMTRASDSFIAYMTDCFISSREGGWRGNLQSDWESLEQFIRNGRDSLAPEQYKRLCDIGFLCGDEIMPIIIRRTGPLCIENFIQKHLRITAEQFQGLTEVSDELDRRVVGEMSKGQPEHIARHIPRYNINHIASGEILARTAEKLIARGLLTELDEAHKKTVFSVMCIQDQIG